MTRLPDHLGIQGIPTEDATVEGVDVIAERLSEGPERERQLHVVESHARHDILQIVERC
jgi:hypothetical protein